MSAPRDLRDALLAVGLAPRPFTRRALSRVPLAAAERALLGRCGLPERGQPGYLRFVRGTGARVPSPLRTLADEYPKLRESPRARARVLLAKDGAGNLLWVDTAHEQALFLFDHDVGRPVVANRDLARFLRCLVAFRRFQIDRGAPDAPWPADGASLAELEELRASLRAIDPDAFASGEALWPRLFEGRLPAVDGA